MAILNAHNISGLEILRENVQEAQQWLGETACVISMFNSQNAGDQPRCSHCYSNVYGQSSTENGVCPFCYGTSYEGGIKSIWLTSIIVSRPKWDYQVQPRGEIAMEWYDIQIPNYCQVWQNDFVLRLNGWNLISQQPLSISPRITTAYQLGVPTYSTLKDGLEYMGTDAIIGTKVQAKLVNMTHPITSLFLKNIPDTLVDWSMGLPQPSQPQNGAVLVPYVQNGTNIVGNATSTTN